VPYNLFRLFLVHKISIYAFLYENRKRKRGKKKEKGFWIARPGGFRPGRARVHGAAAEWAQTAHEERGRRGGCRGRGPTRQREEGVTASGGRRRAVRGGENRSPVNPTAVPRRRSSSGLTKWWQSTGGGRGSRRWSQFGRWTLGMASPRRVAGSAAVRSLTRPTGVIGEGKKGVTCSW
jgi:hypothetical protein